MRPQRDTVLGDRYRLDHQIAVGGMGEVWRAADIVLGRDVAAKVLRADLTDRAGFLERFRREARNLAMLSHPAIAVVFDYGEHDGSPYLIMEFVTGEDLSRRMARHDTMASDEVIDLLAQTSAGLAVAHAAGLVHRDIKPANLMITDRGTVKITDFGISRHTDSLALTSTHELLGTPQYMAPEQLSGHSASPAGDVYSLGIVAYELLVGHPPFLADSNMAVALAQVHDLPPPLPATVPRGLANLIGRALAKDPQRRPPDGQAMVHEIEQLEQLECSEQLDGPDELGSAASPTATDVLFAPTIALPPDQVLVPTAAVTEVKLGGPIAVSSGPERAPSAALIGPMRRHRTKRWISTGLTASTIVVIVSAIVFAGRPAGTDGDAATQPTAAGPVAAVGSTTTSARAPTTSTPRPSTKSVVVIDPSAFVGRDHRQVVDELRALGFVVEERRVETDRDTKKNSVVAVEPSGALEPGTAVEVQVAKPGEDDDD